MERRHENLDAVVKNDLRVLEDVLLERAVGDTRATPRPVDERLDEAVDPEAAERRDDATFEEAPPSELHDATSEA